MRKKGGFGRWCPVLAVAALGVLPLSLSVERAVAGRPENEGAARQSATPTVPSGYERRTLRTGPGLPAHLNIPVLPPVTVDYRNDEGTLSRLSDTPVSGGKRQPFVSGSVAAQPVICRNDAQCNDCNPCTFDACATATCTGGTSNGFECATDADCGGVCAGGVRDAQGCGSDLDCCGDVTAQVPIADGTCTLFSCTQLGDFFCVNPLIPDTCKGGTNDRLACTVPGDCPGGTCEPQFVSGAECDDGLECDGQETCGAGACNAGTPICTSPQVCDEAANQCKNACVDDAECENREAPSNDCTTSKCDQVTGLCFTDPILPCGPGATCTISAKHCTGNNAPCTVSNPDCLGQGTCVGGAPVRACGNGRCCSATGACTNKKFADCTAVGSTWLATESACGQIGTTGVVDGCPTFGAGVAPPGPAIVEIPITTPNNCGGTLTRIGDVYSADSVGGGTGFISVTLMRFVHSAQVSARIAVEFWDVTDPMNPVFIEDTFVPNGTNTGVHGPLVRTAVFDPPLVIPETGVVAFSIASNFSPSGAVSFVTTDAADVGTADAAQMFVGTSLVADFAGQCAGGSRDGLFCDRRNADLDCPGTVAGVCNDVPDILSFELVADANAFAPVGGCCDVGAGTCTQQIKWNCEAQQNTFRGAGVNCAVCLASNNDGTPCDTPAECRICVFPGVTPTPPMTLCTADADCTAIDPAGTCPAGGICTEAVCELNPTTPCLVDSDCTAPGDKCVLIAQCTVQACCNTTNGACSVVVGLGSTCPAGTTSRGFATSCEPDACPQFVDHSADNCTLTTPQFVPVGIPGDPPQSVTMTGSNVPASYDDWNKGLCVDADGVSTGVVCDPNVLPDPDVACTSPNTCSRLCGSGIFNPQGNTRDPGWWVSFSIPAFADVRIDNCESNPLVRPAWAFLDEGCPCNNFLANAGVRAPLGTGVGTPGGARGGPFCPNTDNFWQTYRNLPPGVYNYPIYSAPQSDIFPPVVGGVGGTFQFHITTVAAEIAPCCLPQAMCVRGDLSLDGIAPDGTGTPIPCPLGTECTNPGSTCALCAQDVQPNCELALGSWLSAPVTPASACEGGDNNGLLDCVDDADCPGGTCRTIGTAIACTDPAGGSPCDIGACCKGAGTCDDRLPGDIGPMDRATCDATANGTFFGGAKCEFPVPPCPVCTLESIPGNCQLPNSGFISSMDRLNGGNRKVADDFIAAVSEIGQFCFSPSFLIPDAFGGGECADPNPTGGQATPPPDAFEVRFYEDAGGFPGAELADSPGPVTAAAKRHNPGFRSWSYSIVFNPPLTGFVIGTKYWVEFSGAGSPPPPVGTGCSVFLVDSLDGNLFTLGEADNFGSASWSFEDNAQVLWDRSFCIEGGLTKPPPVIGACCRPCGAVATCTDNVPWEDCVTSFDVSLDLLLDKPPPRHVGDGFFFGGKECIDIAAECQPTGSVGGGCPGAPSGTPGEDCANPIVLTLQPNQPQVVTIQTLCSSTDGRATFTTGDCGLTGSFVSDQWIEFTTVGVVGEPQTMNIDFCGNADFDTALAVYTTGVPGPCPVGTNGCEPDESMLLGGTCNDAGCPAPTAGRPSVQTATEPGVCFLVRVGGDDDQGTMQLEIKNSTGCPDSLTPEDDLVLGGSGAMVQSIKNRFLSFKITESRQKAVRVTVKSLWGPWAVFNGVTKWVDAPIDSSELAGLTLLDVDPPIFKSAGLVDVPVFRDWSGDGVVHVHNELIIPSRRLPGGQFDPATYWIQVVDSTCDLVAPDAEMGFSIPLEIINSKWTDIAELSAAVPGVFVAPNQPGSTPPDTVSIFDVQAMIAKFSGDSNAPIKARVELLGAGDLGPIQEVEGKIDVSNLLAILSAFSGDAYPFPPPPPPDAIPNGVRAVTSR